jgi:hypothetical protein
MPRYAIPFVLVLAVAAIIIAIVLTSFDFHHSKPTPPQSTPRQQTFDQMLQVGSDAIYVEDQTSGATAITVGFAVMKDPGFIVVFNDDGGVPGRLIGSSDLLLAGGEHVPVALNEPLENGKVYYAALYRDDGDGKLDVTKDRQATDADNNVALMTFAAKETAEPEDSPVLP